MERNVLSTINPADVANIKLALRNGTPCLHVLMCNDSVVTYPIETAFQIHDCNNFLKSLKLLPDTSVGFVNYANYIVSVGFCNKLLLYKKVMESVTGISYTEIGILADDVYTVILDRLLVKHHTSNYEAAMQSKPIFEWVAEALEYIRKQAVV